MLTVIEKIEQAKLKREGAEVYVITYMTYDSKGDEHEHTTEVYARNQGDAEHLASLIQIRENKKAKVDHPMRDALTLNMGEMKNHKLGFIFPWRDPIYARSFRSATQVPIKRSLNILRHIKGYLKNPSQINKSDLSDDQIKTLLMGTVKTAFMTAILFVIAIVLLIKGVMNEDGTQYFFSSSFLLVYCATISLQLKNTRAKLFRWRTTHE